MIKKILIEEVRKISKILDKYSVKLLLKNMENTGASFATEEMLETAKNKQECYVCGAQFQMNSQKKLCHSCNKAATELYEAEKLKNDWNNLLTELQVFDSNYILEKEKEKSYSIKIKKDHDYAIIYRDTIHSSFSYYQYKTNHALRISTNDYDIKASRLQNDFGDTSSINKLAKRLHEKSMELLSELKVKNELQIKRDNAESVLKDVIKNNFTDSIITDDGFHDYNSRWCTSGYKLVEIVDILKLCTKDGKVYTLYKSNVEMSVEQVKKVIALLESFK